MIHSSQEYPVFLDHRRKRYVRALEWLFLLLLFASVIAAGVVLTVEPTISSFELHHSKRSLANLAQQALAGDANLAIASDNDAGDRSVAQVGKSQRYMRVSFLDDLRPQSLASLRAHVPLIDVLIVNWLKWTKGGSTVDFAEHKHLASVLHSQSAALDIWSRQDMHDGLPEGPGLRIWERVMKSLNSAADLQLSGLCLENLQHVSASILKATIAALRREFHARGMQLCLVVSTNEIREVGNAIKLADYVVLRHTRTSSFASLTPDSFSNTLREIAQVVPPAKVIIEVGSFAIRRSDKQPVSLISFAQAAIAAQRAQKPIFSTLPIPKLSYVENGQAHEVHLFDVTTAFNLIGILSRTFRCAGVVIASLGLEDPGVWDLVVIPDWSKPVRLAKLRRVKLDNYIIYEGSGDLLSLANRPAEGMRQLTLDATSQFIIKERFIRWPTPWIIQRRGAGERSLVLTFDDGPDERYTPAVLDILKQKAIPATFFVTGSNAAANPGLLRRMLEEGHTIGNHTFSHPNITMIGPSRLKFELNTTERIIEGITKVRAPLFRSPYGEDTEPSSNKEFLSFERITSLGYTLVGMSIDPRDWARPGVQAIVSAALAQARGGGHVILLHDAGGDRTQTVEALPQLIDQLQGSGFQFISIAKYAGLPKKIVQPPLTQDQWWVPWSTKGGLLIYSAILHHLPLLFAIAAGFTLLRTFFLFGLAALYRPTRLICNNARSSVAVVIPAYNEERTVVRTVNSVIESNCSLLEVIVVDDGSTDATLTVLQQAFANHPMVRLMTKPNGGKASALNHGITHTSAEVIVLIDADTLIDKEAIRLLSAHFTDLRVAAVAGNIKVGNRRNFLAQCQALEYITGQNFERRAYATINAMTVVPGAIGAWRRHVVIEVGGLTSDTLAEDADLTWKVLRAGYIIRNEPSALAYTEAPLSVRDFLTQRFRWGFGTLQVAWKHKGVIKEGKRSNLALVALPSVIFFQCILPVLAPFIDLYFLAAILSLSVDQVYHPMGGASERLGQILIMYVMFVGVDMSVAAAAYAQEGTEQKRLLLVIPLQRFLYRQLLYYTAARSLHAALLGAYVGWQNLIRTATVIQGRAA